jgi:hypothetical protein
MGFRGRITLIVLAAALALVIAGQDTRAIAADSKTNLPGNHEVAAGKAIGNLTVFAITASSQRDVGPVTTLDDALARGTAEVREISEGGSVNQLAIVNRGAVPIFALAGTIVKGGKQDRQIGQDFIVGANQTVPVDAFCVEHGRWSAERGGVATGGKFGTMSQLANSNVRAAGQYQKNQSQVWAKVADTNGAAKKSAASGTLMATLDDAEIKRRRDAIVASAKAAIDGTTPADSVVGFAYAIDGQVRGVRWFVNHKVFVLFEKTLLNTAAIDSITSAASGQRPRAASASPSDVASFVASVEKEAVKEKRSTAGQNDNEYKDSDKAYGSKTMLKPSPAAPKAPAVEFSSDYLSH